MKNEDLKGGLIEIGFKELYSSWGNRYGDDSLTRSTFACIPVNLFNDGDSFHVEYIVDDQDVWFIGGGDKVKITHARKSEFKTGLSTLEDFGNNMHEFIDFYCKFHGRIDTFEEIILILDLIGCPTKQTN